MSGADPQQSPLSRPVALSDVIESHLEKIQRSGVFSTADSLRRLLRFVVLETIAGRGDDVKEYSLGVSVLGKGDSFDPKADPIVRVQMRRLREHLARYYAADGRSDPLIIDIPKGRYVPVFRTAAAGGSAPVLPEAAPLTVGQEKETAALRLAFESAAAGDGRMFCLFGEPGIGKTTIVEVFLRELSTSGVRCTVGRGRCSERLAGSEAYLPVLEALESVLQGGEPFHRLMKEVAPTWYLQLARSMDDQAMPPAPAENRVASQERLKRDLVSFFTALAREQPLVLFFDDLHWADASTVDALAYVVPRCRAHRILVVGTYRPAELLATNQAFLRAKLELQAHDAWREVPMQLLTRLDVVRYLALQFPDHRFPQELAARVHGRTEGNPLFVADLVRFLRDRNVLAHRDDQWVMMGDLTEVELDLPDSVRSMVQKKIAELDDADRKLLSAAAVLGLEFDSAVVARALGMDAVEAEERLQALDRTRGFVRLIGDRDLPAGTLTLEYAFVHSLYQNALHAALAPTRKASMSLTVAEAVLTLHGNKSGEKAAQLALLFEAGRDFARASDFFLLASQNAGRMYAAEQSIALARQSASSRGQARRPRALVARDGGRRAVSGSTSSPHAARCGGRRLHAGRAGRARVGRPAGRGRCDSRPGADLLSSQTDARNEGVGHTCHAGGAALRFVRIGRGERRDSRDGRMLRGGPARGRTTVRSGSSRPETERLRLPRVARRPVPRPHAHVAARTPRRPRTPSSGRIGRHVSFT